jgi:hypothetical protein
MKSNALSALPLCATAQLRKKDTLPVRGMAQPVELSDAELDRVSGGFWGVVLDGPVCWPPPHCWPPIVPLCKL